MLRVGGEGIIRICVASLEVVSLLSHAHLLFWYEKLRGLSGQSVYHATFATSLPYFSAAFFLLPPYARLHQSGVNVGGPFILWKLGWSVRDVAHWFYNVTCFEAWEFEGFGSRQHL